jgi:hypothetical protein
VGRNGFDSRWRTLELTIEAEQVLIACMSTRSSKKRGMPSGAEFIGL